MMSDTDTGHFLDVTAGFARIVCKAPETAPCRSGCAETQYGCEAWRDSDSCPHPKTRPLGHCGIAAFVSEDDDTAEDEHPLVPVSIRWDDLVGGYRWRITGPPAARS